MDKKDKLSIDFILDNISTSNNVELSLLHEKILSMSFATRHALTEALNNGDISKVHNLLLSETDNPYSAGRPGTTAPSSKNSPTKSNPSTTSTRSTTSTTKPYSLYTAKDISKAPSRTGSNATTSTSGGVDVDLRKLSPGDKNKYLIRHNNGKEVVGNIAGQDTSRYYVQADDGLNYTIDKQSLNKFKIHKYDDKLNRAARTVSSVAQKAANAFIPSAKESLEIDASLKRIKELAGIKETTCAGSIASVAMPIVNKPANNKRSNKKKKRRD